MTSERVPVTVDNFVRAESDNYFRSFGATAGLGRFHHAREAASIDHQNVVRMNRDTLYSSAVFDLDAGPVTVTLPDAGRRFMSMQVISEDHHTPLVSYDAGRHVITRELVETRYVCVLIRTLVDPTDPGDMRAVHELQDGIRAEQAGQGRLDLPDWDQASLATVRDTLKRVAPAVGHDGGFGPKGQVDPIRHLIATATGWGGNPASDATYVGGYPAHNDGATAHAVTVGDVPVDGFWSISVYNRDGFFEKNAENAYAVNNLTAARNGDGTVTVHFGGPAGTANHLPITPGWNYVVRLYRPRPEILDHSWTFPQPEPVD